jgi:hypothetical protein
MAAHSLNEEECFSPEETARRRDEAIRRALNTPPKPHKAMVGKGKRAKERKQSRVTPSRRAKPK